MANADWIGWANPDEVLVFLEDKAVDRPLRLFCCACVRRVWYRLTDLEASRRAVETAERFADGLATPEELNAAFNDADKDIRSQLQLQNKNACRAAEWSASPEMDALGTARSVAWGSTYASRYEADVERASQLHLLRDIFERRFDTINFDFRSLPSALTSTASQMYESDDFTAMPQLAETLENAGCNDSNLLAHCREAGPHIRGCWAIDLILLKS